MVASHNEDTVKFTLRRWVLGRQRGMAGTGGSRDGGAGPAELQRGVLWLVRSPLRSRGDPNSHLVLRALVGAWSWGTAWWLTAAAELAPWPSPEAVLKTNPSSPSIPASTWDVVSAVLSYSEMIPAPLVGHAVSALP